MYMYKGSPHKSKQSKHLDLTTGEFRLSMKMSGMSVGGTNGVLGSREEGAEGCDVVVDCSLSS